MSSLVGRGLPAALAIAVIIGGNTAATPPAAAQTTHDIIIHTGDYRTSSASGMLGGSTTGGNVAPPLPGVTYNVYDTSTPPVLVGDCTSDNTGTCRVSVTPGTYTVKQVSAPSGYFLSPVLGTGPATPTPAPIVASDYSTVTVTVGNSDVNVPTQNNFATSPDTVRSDLWAVSRNNPAPPDRCARNLALLFDLSASISEADLNTYKTSATGFVQALVGSNTNVTVYTFGTRAGTPNNGTFTGNTLDAAGVADLVTKIDAINRPSSQYTNWDAGIWQIVADNAAGARYDEAFVLTDGDPTAFGSDGGVDTVFPAAVSTRFRDVENGIFSANALKRQGTRVIAVGLEGPGRRLGGAAGRALPGSIANLMAISGPTERSDYFLVPFDTLDTELPSLAVADCASLVIKKVPSPTTYNQLDQTITYTYTVTNTGPADGFTITGITVADQLTGGCFIGDLAPGQSATCTATYKVTQADLTNGSITNTATASGTTNGVTIDSNEATATVNVVALELTKSVNPGTVSKAGDSVTYTYTVTNTGKVAVDNIAITDTSTGTGTKPAITCTPTSLDPGASATCTATYAFTAQDIAAGHVDNTAVANGTGPNGEPVTSNQATATVTVTVVPPPPPTPTPTPKPKPPVPPARPTKPAHRIPVTG